MTASVDDIVTRLDDAGGRQRVEAELIAQLERQRKLYLQLGLLAERQRTLVVSDDVQPLLTLLAERQRLVESLAEVHARLAPYRRNWTAVYGALDGANKKKVTGLLEEANAVLGSILRSDGRDCDTLSARRREMSERLSAFDAGSRAGAAYAGAAAGSSGRWTDTEG